MSPRGRRATHAAIHRYDRGIIWYRWACDRGSSDIRTTDLRLVTCKLCLRAIEKKWGPR